MVSHAALTACLFGAAWLAWSYLDRPARTVIQPESVQSAEMGRGAPKMAEESDAEKAKVEALPAAQSLSTEDTAYLGGTKPHLDTVKTEISAGIAEVAGKVEHRDRNPRRSFPKEANGSIPLDTRSRRSLLPLQPPTARHPRRSPENAQKAGAAMPSIRPEIPRPRALPARLEPLPGRRRQTARRRKSQRDKEPIKSSS